MPSNTRLICECGQRTRDGRCPTCDYLRSPSRRATALTNKLRKRVKESSAIGKKGEGNLVETMRNGFKQACKSLGVTPYVSPIQRRRRAKP